MFGGGIEVTFADRTAVLQRLDQSLTYAGLIEGVPGPGTNERIIGEALKAAKPYWHHRDPLLVPPPLHKISFLRESPKLYESRLRLPRVRLLAPTIPQRHRAIEHRRIRPKIRRVLAEVSLPFKLHMGLIDSHQRRLHTRLHHPQ